MLIGKIIGIIGIILGIILFLGSLAIGVLVFEFIDNALNDPKKRPRAFKIALKPATASLIFAFIGGIIVHDIWTGKLIASWNNLLIYLLGAIVIGLLSIKVGLKVQESGGILYQKYLMPTFILGLLASFLAFLAACPFIYQF